jgi:hypothetical protein
VTDDLGLGVGDDWYDTRPVPAGSGVTGSRTPGGGLSVTDVPPPHDTTAPDVPPSSDHPQADVCDDGWYDEEPPVWLDDDAPPPWADATVPDLAPFEWTGTTGPGRPATSDADSVSDPVTDPVTVFDPAEVVRDVLAACHGRPAAEVLSATDRIRSAAGLIFRDVAQETVRTILHLVEVLAADAASLDGVGVVDFDHVFAIRAEKAAVRVEFDALRVRRPQVPPLKALETLIELAQRQQCRADLKRLANAIDSGEPTSRLAELFTRLSPPTRRGAVTAKTWAKTAGEWLDEHEARSGGQPQMILSSGLPTLDRALTAKGDVPGLVGLGEFWVIAAGSGHGKSSFTRRFISAATEDIVNGWGYPHATSILAFTEEEAPDVAEAAMLAKGSPFHHLRDNVVLAKVGESRLRIVEVFFDQVRRAARLSRETGMPVDEFAPRLLVLDYVQGVKQPGENPFSEGVQRTADLLMRGVAACDPEMIAHISGLDYRTYTGEDWPEGLDHHRVAVVVLSQLTKEPRDVRYRAGKSKIGDFAVLDENGQPYWEPQENDYAIPSRADLAGSAVLTNHATGILFLHRSQPTGPIRTDPVTKRTYVVDQRARIIVEKARKGVQMPYVPVRYDSNPSGRRGQFYDFLAEEYIVGQKRQRYQDCFTRSGDPILPVRPPRSPFRVRY